MNVITPIQSDFIACEILAQARLLNEMSDLFAPRWGARGRYRMTRLFRSRMELLTASAAATTGAKAPQYEDIHNG